MAQNKSTSVLLLLVFCLGIQCIVGRHLILDQQSHNFHKVQPYGRILLAKETATILDRKVNFHGDNNVNTAGVGSTQSPPSPPSPTVGIGAAPPKNVDDFRPTAPGHSPGVGHSLQN